MKPTPELRRHVDLEDPKVDATTFRQGWRIRTRLDQLVADRRISPGEYQAATEYRAAWTTARGLAKAGPALTRVAGNKDPDAGMVLRLTAATRVRVTDKAIGDLAAALVRVCVIDDLAWAAIGRKLQRNPETARDWTVLAIHVLAAAWNGTVGVAPQSPLQAYPRRRRPPVKRS
jgi:hypothetical protein